MCASSAREILVEMLSYVCRAQSKLYEMLRNGGGKKIFYRDLFCEVMAFPLVTPSDLVSWINALAPAVSLELTGSGRRKPAPAEDDLVVVNDSSGVPSN